jgi:hypothetical protein
MITEQHSSSTRQPRQARSPRRHPAVSRPRPAFRLVVLVLLGFATTLSAVACQPAAVPWTPSSEDNGVDTGPDPGTCEYRRDCVRLSG